MYKSAGSISVSGDDFEYLLSSCNSYRIHPSVPSGYPSPKIAEWDGLHIYMEDYYHVQTWKKEEKKEKIKTHINATNYILYYKNKTWKL